MGNNGLEKQQPGTGKRSERRGSTEMLRELVMLVLNGTRNAVARTIPSIIGEWQHEYPNATAALTLSISLALGLGIGDRLTRTGVIKKKVTPGKVVITREDSEVAEGDNPADIARMRSGEVGLRWIPTKGVMGELAERKVVIGGRETNALVPIAPENVNDLRILPVPGTPYAIDPGLGAEVPNTTDEEKKYLRYLHPQLKQFLMEDLGAFINNLKEEHEEYRNVGAVVINALSRWEKYQEELRKVNPNAAGITIHAAGGNAVDLSWSKLLDTSTNPPTVKWIQPNSNEENFMREIQLFLTEQEREEKKMVNGGEITVKAKKIFFTKERRRRCFHFGLWNPGNNTEPLGKEIDTIHAKWEKDRIEAAQRAQREAMRKALRQQAKKKRGTKAVQAVKPLRKGKKGLGPPKPRSRIVPKKSSGSKRR